MVLSEVRSGLAVCDGRCRGTQGEARQGGSAVPAGRQSGGRRPPPGPRWTGLHAGLGSSDRDREPEAELTFSLVDAAPAGYCSRHKKKPSGAS